jgi:hypothetical protein
MTHSSTISLRQLFARIALLLAVACLSGCGLPLTDGATRLAGDIGDAAKKLRESRAPRIEIQHKPIARPEGVKGRYEVVMQPSLNHPRSGGSLLVRDLDSPEYKNHGYNWSTSSHLNFVRVPRELRVTKSAGEPIVIVLERGPDGTVDATGLRC